MDNAQLRLLVGLYYNCKDQLNALKEQAEKDKIVMTPISQGVFKLEPAL